MNQQVGVDMIMIVVYCVACWWLVMHGLSKAHVKRYGWHEHIQLVLSPLLVPIVLLLGIIVAIIDHVAEVIGRSAE
jgi:lysylphosphatidylglycerol synthetase-like protein (DUF2156 family)